MEGNRIISGNSIGNGNVFIQGNLNVNNHAEGSQKQGEHDILQRLYTSPYRDRKDRNPPRVPGTCDWFVSHRHFRTWSESDSSSLLWVSADPGCGKSVLVKHLVDSVVHTTESRTVCYFFFKDDFLDQKSVTSALSCILRQIFIQKPSLLSDEILKRFKSGGETFNTSFSELWQTLIQVAETNNAGEIVCLLDAIDECEHHSEQGRSELLRALCTLYGAETKTSTNLKFLLTSRPYVEIYRGLQPLQLPGLPVIHLSGESEEEIKKISLEINTYIGARVKDFGERLHLSGDERHLLLQKLMRVPNRTYLWVYLVLNFIENSINVHNKMIYEATSSIPTTVDEAYERILSKSLDTEQARIALHIIVAAARPLTLTEMNFALALDKGDHQSFNDLGLVPHDRFRETLRNICGLCVVVVDSSVYLLHQTVKEFLVRDNDVQINERRREWKWSLSTQESHRILAKACIWYLLRGSKMVSNSATRHDWREIFLDYSAKHWASHFRQMPVEAQSKMTKSVLSICDVTSSYYQTWFGRYWTTTNTAVPEGFTTLMAASYFGLNEAVGSLLAASDIQLDTQDGTYQRTALCWAARNGFQDISELLLGGIRQKLGILKLPFHKRAKVDSQDKYGRAALTYAVWNGNVALVQRLIKAGARVNLRDELDGTPLSYAFCNGNAQIIDLLAKKKHVVDIEDDINRLLLSAAGKGHEEVVSLLLKTNRVDTQTRSLASHTPLIIAANGRHEGIVKLLLEAGAYANSQDRNGRTALMIASWGGLEATAKLLLKTGADPNSHNDNGQTALKYASDRGHKMIVQLLLEAGADVNAHDSHDNTVLMTASVKGHEEIAKCLLEKGADVNACNDYGRTALRNASWIGSKEIVKLLLEAGADVNFCDKKNEIALMDASRKGHIQVTKLLLEAGADMKAQDESGETALIKASKGGHLAIVNLLLQAGADIDAKNHSEDTVLLTAYRERCGVVVKSLSFIGG